MIEEDNTGGTRDALDEVNALGIVFLLNICVVREGLMFRFLHAVLQSLSDT